MKINQEVLTLLNSWDLPLPNWATKKKESKSTKSSYPSISIGQENSPFWNWKRLPKSWAKTWLTKKYRHISPKPIWTMMDSSLEMTSTTSWLIKFIGNNEITWFIDQYNFVKNSRFSLFNFCYINFNEILFLIYISA